jgi:hypothetical protein
MIPAITYFRTCGHYHRPEELNDRVRNGNECDLPGKVTGNEHVCPVKAAHAVVCFKTWLVISIVRERSDQQCHPEGFETNCIVSVARSSGV